MTKNEYSKEICKLFFKDDYQKPLEISDGQVEIFNAIYFKEHPRVNIIASTQYGKSTIIACALILRTLRHKDGWAVIAGRKDKANIIMEKVIQHIFDSAEIIKKLDIDRQEPLERLKRERSKERITWKGGGEIRTYSAQTKSMKMVNDALTGFGSPNIVEDESALIPDPFQTMILRMLGGHAKNTLIKVGNPFYRNHFYQSSNSKRYRQIFIDYNQALKEGRYTQEFIDEAKEMMLASEFSVLYECKFPDDSEIDQSGYYRLYSDEVILGAKKEVQHTGDLKLGFDVGEGGDENVGVLRSSTYAQVIHRSRIKDLMATTRVIIDLMKDYKVEAGNVFIDATGIGAGVVARLKEIGHDVMPVKWAEKPSKDIFLNLKSENFYLSEGWLRGGGKLDFNDGWNELMIVKWKKDTQDRIKIKSKDEMRKEGIKSPNIADAFALSFNKSVEEQAPRVW
jgi:hypothetical protein